MRIACDTEEDMLALGQRLGCAMQPGTVVALDGDLGAGKTVLSRGIARGLGITGRIPSPTYVIVNVHPGGRIPLIHGDLYRLADDEELEQLGLEDWFDGTQVVVLEWAAQFASALPGDRLDITIRGDDTRQVELRATGPVHQQLLERVRE